MHAPNVAPLFAVIRTGGKQYRVSANDLIVVERLADPQGEPLGSGDQVAFGDVLMLTDGDNINIGAPIVTGAAVLGEIVQQKRSAKIRVFKKRRRSTYRRRAGHRQHQSVVRILEIAANGLTAPLRRGEPVTPETSPVKSARADKAAGAAADDLTLISGVGAAIAKKLSAMGVTNFQQIIDLDDAALAALDEKIGFKGRAIREDWRAQATELKAGGTPRAKIDQEAAAEKAEAPAGAKKAKAAKAPASDMPAPDGDGDPEVAPKKPRATKKKTEE